MKILKINIQNFRGIVDLDLDLNGKNAVIFGPNGVGKSAVVDAVDFLLRGEVLRLTGEGTGEVSTIKNGPHIGHEPQDAIVTATLQSSSGVIFTAERSVAQRDTVKLSPDCTDEFKEMATYARSGAHCLARRELLRYIMARPSERAAQIKELLDIADTKTIRDAFTKLKKITKNKLAEATDSLRRCSEDILTNVGAASESQILDRVNLLRKVLGGNEIESLDQCILTHGLTYSDTKENSDITYCIRTLESLLKYIPTLRPNLKESLQQIQNTITKIANEHASIENVNYISLINEGIALMNGSGRCPLCMHQWTSEEELQNILEERKEKSIVLSRLLDEYNRLVTIVLKNFSMYRVGIGNLTQQLTKWDNGCISEINSEISKIEQILFPESNAYKNHEEIERLVTAFINDRSPSNLLDLIDKQLITLRSLIDENSREKSNAWQALNTAQELISKKRSLNEKMPDMKLRLKKAEILMETYDRTQTDILNKLFESISERFTEFYKALHIEDEEKFTASLNNDGAGVVISVDFHEKGQFSPVAYHSEGHQDSMGIALFFALMEKLTTSESGLVVLDDVVMSVDIEHRKNFCRLLKKFFPDRQFIITTHDKVWARNLVNEGIVDSKNSIEFLYWSVQDGPVKVVGQNIWDSCRQKAHTDISGASGYLRREMECYFEKICDKLHARIRYNDRHKWDYGQYMNAAYSELQELIRKAKKQAQEYKQTETEQQLDTLASTLREQNTKVNAENWVTNVLIHYNPDYEISKSELLAAIMALEEFCKCFECPTCNTPISAIYTGDTPVSLRCNCGKYTLPIKS